MVDVLADSGLRPATTAGFDWEYWIAPDGTLRDVSPSCEEITGFPPSAFQDDPALVRAIVHPDDRPAFAAHCITERNGSGPGRIDFRIVTQGGEVRWISHVCRSILDARGTVLGRRVSNRDITPRVQAETALRQRSVALEALHDISLRLSTAMDLETLLFVIVDQARTLLNAEMGVVFLYEEATNDFVIRVATEGLEHLRGQHVALDEGVSGHVYRERRTLVVDNYGEWPGRLARFAVTAALRPMLGVPLKRLDEILGVLSIAGVTNNPFTEHDVWLAELFAAHATLALENARLRQAEQAHYQRMQETRRRMAEVEKIAALGSLAAALAHEINNPLQAIQSHLELVMDFALPPERQTEFLGVVRHEVGRLKGIVQRVLDYARPNAVPRHRVAVAELVEQTLDLVRKQLQRAGVTVGVDVAPGLEIAVAPDQAMQVILNLLLNAIEAAGPGGSVQIAGHQAGSRVQITVTDSGPGIPSEILGRLFEPFFTTKPQGTGLGLAVSRSLVDQQGGTLTAANRAGGPGAVFTISLPALDAAKDPP